MTNFKRQWRELSDEHKQIISHTSAGKPKSPEHREHISQGLRDYWAGVPHKPGQGDVSMADFLGISSEEGGNDGGKN